MASERKSESDQRVPALNNSEYICSRVILIDIETAAGIWWWVITLVEDLATIDLSLSRPLAYDVCHIMTNHVNHSCR